MQKEELKLKKLLCSFFLFVCWCDGPFDKQTHTCTFPTIVFMLLSALCLHRDAVSHFSLRKAGQEVRGWHLCSMEQKQTHQVLRWPLLWKSCCVSVVANNDRNVLGRFSFCLDASHCYQTSWSFFCCVSRVEERSIVSELCNWGHGHRVSTFSLIRKHSGLTAGAHDLTEWTGWGLHSLTLPLNIPQYSYGAGQKRGSQTLKLSVNLAWMGRKQSELKPRLLEVLLVLQIKHGVFPEISPYSKMIKCSARSVCMNIQ